MINAVCPNPKCGRSLKMEERFIGKKVACIHCHQPFQVEVVSPSATATAATAPDATTTPGLPGWDVFGEKTIAGPMPAGYPSAPSMAPPVPSATHPPAPARVPTPPTPGGPPPLPPRSQSVGAGLRVGPLLVSIVSIAITAGSLAGIVHALRGPTPETAGEAPAAENVPAERWAAVAIESGGVRLVIVDGKKVPGAPEIAPVHVTNRDWKLGDLPPALTARPSTFDELEGILAKYNEALAANNVPADRRLVACNSGVFGSAKDAERAKLQEWFRASVKKTLNRDVEIVDAALEAEYGARGSIPPNVQVRMKAVSMDIGSSATRFGYFDTPKTFRGSEFKAGAKSAQTEITNLMKSKPGKAPFRAAAAEWKRANDEAIRKLANETPPLKNHERYYLLGGTPWAVTVLSHPQEFGTAPDDRPGDIPITPGDIDLVLRLTEEKPDFTAVKAAVLEKVPAGPSREQADVELTRVGNAFTLERLSAAATLLKSYSDECQFSKKQVRFFTRSLFAWPLGYILVKGNFEQ
jgi:hypothetical protein